MMLMHMTDGNVTAAVDFILTGVPVDYGRQTVQQNLTAIRVHG